MEINWYTSYRRNLWLTKRKNKFYGAFFFTIRHSTL